MVSATFRFYEELNDFLALAPARRRQAFTVPCAQAIPVRVIGSIKRLFGPG